MEYKSQILFDGKLANFNGIDDQELQSGKEDKIRLTIKFPEESGNEYQGAKTDFDFMIYANGILASTVSNGFSGGKLPNTGQTYPVYIFLAGSAIIFAGLLLLLFNKMKVLKVKS